MAALSAARRLARFVLARFVSRSPRRRARAGGRARPPPALDTLGNCLAASGEDFGRAVIARPSGWAARPRARCSAPAGRGGRPQRRARQRHARPRPRLRRHARGRHRPHRLRRGHHRAGGRRGGRAPRAARCWRPLIAGVEVMCRVGLAVPGALHARHFHPTAHHRRASRAAAAAGEAPRPLPRTSSSHAFGICGSQAGGIIEYLADGSWTKRLHPGWARARGRGRRAPRAGRLHRARDASSRARTASTRPSRAATTPPRLDALLDEPRPRRGSWRELTFKPYPCGSIAQPYMDCALRLRERHRLRPGDDRARSAAAPPPGPCPRLWEPLAAKHAPPNGYAAKFSLPYLIAVDPGAGAGRGSPSSPTTPCATPTVLAVAGRVALRARPDASTTRASSWATSRSRWPTAASLRERQDRPRGGPDAPLTREELEAKFRGNAGAGAARRRRSSASIRARATRSPPAPAARRPARTPSRAERT